MSKDYNKERDKFVHEYDVISTVLQNSATHEAKARCKQENSLRRAHVRLPAWVHSSAVL